MPSTTNVLLSPRFKFYCRHAKQAMAVMLRLCRA